MFGRGCLQQVYFDASLVTFVDEMKDMMRRMKAGNGALITPIRLCIALLNTRRAVT